MTKILRKCFYFGGKPFRLCLENIQAYSCYSPPIFLPLPPMSSLGKMLKEFKEYLDSDEDEGRVIRSIDVRPEWQPHIDKLEALMNEGKELTHKLEQLVRKKQAFNDVFWAAVAEDLEKEGDKGAYVDKHRYNRETKKIEVYED